MRTSAMLQIPTVGEKQGLGLNEYAPLADFLPYLWQNIDSQ